MAEEPPSADQRYHDRCLELIKQFGWMVQGVCGGTNILAYTVGLNLINVPELVIVGANDMQQACMILNDAANIHIREPFAPGTYVDIGWTIQDRPAPLKIREVSSAGLYTAMDLNGAHYQPTALQLVWTLVWTSEHGTYRDDLTVPTN